ncbi:MAG: hypothetical protein A2W19_05970 [Spirochaetes bacterium RBG_16_49_21]|nr:MAG: hypothetical protein A2W19_05970 [Spirochaetes bacterium RBG_16_49_21]
MAEEKSFLQSIKLEISRSFRLVPYERLSFHKILGILKSDVGMNILIRELDKGPVIRQSAVSTLVRFDTPEVLAACVALLKKHITDEEKIMILDLVSRCGGETNIKDIIAFIEYHEDKQPSLEVITKAYEVIRKIGAGSDEALKFLTAKAHSDKLDTNFRSLAIESLAPFKPIGLFEEVLKKCDDALCHAVYKAVYLLVVELVDKAQLLKTDDDRLFTYSPDSEDKIMLDIRVLLGKMTGFFDSYSNRTKIAFICAMMACNHREHLIYIMKALTSNDADLVNRVLYSLNQNIVRLRDPDKLFRNLIAISTELYRFNELIVDVFVRYFSRPVDTRGFHLLKDKLFGYIVVTLEAYFETYRKEFMITDVIEKGLPESFQRIRRFILNNGNPELKKEIAAYLAQDDLTPVKDLLAVMSKRTTFVEDSDTEDLTLFIEVLLDKDRKSRENSARRIEDLNFEKLYLRNRIVRLCRMIGLLKINEAASVLVNIYNYLKKYPDREILEAVMHTLSMLNYSYMLGEIEVMMTAGSGEDPKNALRILSLFTEQRSLNILLEFLKNHITDESGIVEGALNILIEREISGNITASQTFKGLIASNGNPAVRSLAVLGIGECGFDADIDYLNELFYKMNHDESKDAIVRAIASIITRSTSYNKRQLMHYLQEYLKDPGIKVRIYSCLILVHLGNREALRSIRDMLIIKNKAIQRDILTILGDLRSIEFSFFLLSLLKEEYGISKDIIPVIVKLPEEDMREIDAYIVNIFRKYEAPAMEGVQLQPGEPSEIAVSGVKTEKVTIVNIVIPEQSRRAGGLNIPELINLNLRIKALIASALAGKSGVIIKMSNDNIVAYFSDAKSAAEASIQISRNMDAFNSARIVEHRIDVYTQILTETVKIINDEIIEFPIRQGIQLQNFPLKNKIAVDAATAEIINSAYSVREIPRLVVSAAGYAVSLFELLAPVNFLRVVERIMAALKEEGDKHEQMQKQVEDQLKRMKQERRAAPSMVIARELDSLGHTLQNQLDEIDRYVQKRSTDRELIKNVRKMLSNVHNLYKVEISRIIID